MVVRRKHSSNSRLMMERVLVLVAQLLFFGSSILAVLPEGIVRVLLCLW